MNLKPALVKGNRHRRQGSLTRTVSWLELDMSMCSVGTDLTKDLTPNNSPRNFANANTADSNNAFASIFNSVMTAQPPGLPLFASDGSISTEGTLNIRTNNLRPRRSIPAEDGALTDAEASIKSTSTFSSYEEKSSYQSKALNKMARFVIDLKDNVTYLKNKLKKASGHVAYLKNKLISKTRLVKDLKSMVDSLMKILVENEQEIRRLKKENSALHLGLDEQV